LKQYFESEKFVNKINQFIEFCERKFQPQYDKNAALTFTGTVLRTIRKNMFKTITDPEDFGIPNNIYHIVEKYLESNDEIYTLVQMNVDTCQKIESILASGDVDVLMTGAFTKSLRSAGIDETVSKITKLQSQKTTKPQSQVIIKPKVPDFVDETIPKNPNSQSFIIEKVLDFVDFCQLRMMKIEHKYDIGAACSFIASVLRSIRKRELVMLYKNPENYGLPSDICIFVKDYLQYNKEIEKLLQNNIELCIKIEKILNSGEINIIRSGASQRT